MPNKSLCNADFCMYANKEMKGETAINQSNEVKRRQGEMNGYCELTFEEIGLAQSCKARRLRSLEHMSIVRGAAAIGSHPATTARMFCKEQG